MNEINNLDKLHTVACGLADKHSHDESGPLATYWNTIANLAHEAKLRQDIAMRFNYEYECDIKLLNDLLLQLETLLEFGESVYWLHDEISINVKGFINSNKIK